MLASLSDSFLPNWIYWCSSSGGMVEGLSMCQSQGQHWGVCSALQRVACCKPFFSFASHFIKLCQEGLLEGHYKVGEGRRTCSILFASSGLPIYFLLPLALPWPCFFTPALVGHSLSSSCTQFVISNIYNASLIMLHRDISSS